MASKKYDRITVVIPSQKKPEDRKELLNNVVNTVDYPMDIIFVSENKLSLTKVYQDVLDNSKNDIIIYMHDDIEFLKSGWGKEVVDIFTKYPQYGILGVAGTREYGEKDKYAWWEYQNKRGLVFHGNKEKSWLTFCSDYNKKSPVSEVVLVDGLFMAVNRDKINYDFDTDVKGFHFYDIDFCLANFLSRRCKVGVTDRICIRHSSVGQVNEEWLKNAKEIFEKYKNNFPLKTFGK